MTSETHFSQVFKHPYLSHSLRMSQKKEQNQIAEYALSQASWFYYMLTTVNQVSELGWISEIFPATSDRKKEYNE